MIKIMIEQDTKNQNSSDFKLSPDGKILEKFLAESTTNVVVPEGVTKIGDHAFDDCKNLKSIKLPQGLKVIYHYAFEGCSNLSEITIPKSVTKIKYGVFDGCPNLTIYTTNPVAIDYAEEEGISYVFSEDK